MAVMLAPNSLVAQGRTAEVYAWRDGQVLKLFHAWCPPAWIEQEREISRIIATTGLPTPRLLDAVTVAGRQGLVYERVEGASMLAECSARPWRLLPLARQLAELHSQLHRHDGSGLLPLRPALRERIEQVPQLPPELKAGALRVLDELPDGAALCHFDFHPDQVLLTARGPVVIDWMTALQGDPLADVARTAIILRTGQLPYGGWGRRAFVGLWRGLFRRVYLAHYRELHPGSAFERVGSWMAPVAAARLYEGIAGESEALLRMLRSVLFTRGAARVVNETGPGTRRRR